MADQMEQQLAAGLSEGKVTEFVEDDEVQSGKPISHPALAVGPGLGFEFVDQIDDIEEPSAGAVANAGSGNGYGKMRFPGAGSADQHAVALVLKKVAGRQVAHQGLVDRRALEHEVVDILSGGRGAPRPRLGRAASWR